MVNNTAGYLIQSVPSRILELPSNENEKAKYLAQIIKRIILRAQASRIIRTFTLKVLEDKKVPPKNRMGEIQAIFEFVRDNIPYRSDPTFLDTFVEPEQTVRDYLFGQIRGADCDDKSLLLASMLISVGYTPRLVLSNSCKGCPYTHIFVQVLNPKSKDSWISLESTEKVSMGWAPPAFKYGIIQIT